MRDYGKVIKDDIDWYMENFSIDTIQISKTINEEWHYILKIKLGPAKGRPASKVEDEEFRNPKWNTMPLLRPSDTMTKRDEA